MKTPVDDDADDGDNDVRVLIDGTSNKTLDARAIGESDVDDWLKNVFDDKLGDVPIERLVEKFKLVLSVPFDFVNDEKFGELAKCLVSISADAL